MEDDEVFILNKEKFMKGIKKFIEEGSGADAVYADYSIYIDPGKIDAGGADSIIQCALFGEIVYG